MNDSKDSRANPVRPAHPLKVLVLSRNYPNNVLELLGLWVERLVRHSTLYCAPKVVAPVPYCPPLAGVSSYYAQFRRILSRRWSDGIEVFHPRFLVGPGYWLHSFEWMTYYLAVRRLVDRLRREFPFQIIHAHFTYPDGVVAARLARRYGVPLVITEQVPWRPWMEDYPLVRRRALWAAKESEFHIAISTAVKDSIEYFVGKSPKLRVIPDGVDGSVFTLPQNGRPRTPNQVLFVGVIRPVKGVDILLKAMSLLRERGRDANLLLVGEPYYQKYRQEEVRLREMVRGLRLEGKVNFAGKKPLPELVRHMQESAMLVLPSRAESFGSVLVEALACGTPVVATRCGGPEDIVNEKVGVLVPTDDPEALSRAVEQVLDRRAQYDPSMLREYALQNFGLDSVGRRVADVYREALGTFHALGRADIANPNQA